MRRHQVRTRAPLNVHQCSIGIETECAQFTRYSVVSKSH